MQGHDSGADEWQSEQARQAAGEGFQRPATVSAVIEAIAITLRRVIGAPLVAWAVLGLVDLIFVLVLMAAMMLSLGGVAAGIESENFAAAVAMAFGSVVFFVVQFALLMIVQSLRVALYGPLRDMVVGGGASPPLGVMLRQMASRIVPVLVTSIVVGGMVTLGLVACILPGFLAMALLCMAPYYAATGSEPMDAVRRSYETVKVNVGIFVLGLFALLVIFGGVMVGQEISNMVMVAVFGDYGIYAAMVGQWAVQFILGFALWIAGAGFFIAVDAADRGESIG